MTSPPKQPTPLIVAPADAPTPPRYVLFRTNPDLHRIYFAGGSYSSPNWTARLEHAAIINHFPTVEMLMPKLQAGYAPVIITIEEAP